jgi:hypothetical protein
MEKKLLINFSLVLIFGIFGLIALALTLKQLGLSEYTTHTTRYWNDEQHYAKLFNKNYQAPYLAKGGEVNAQQGSQRATNAITWAAVRFFTASDSNASGFVFNMLGGVVNETGQFTVGCRYTDYQEAKLTGTNERCNIDELIYNSPDFYVSPTEQNGMLPGQIKNNAGLVGVVKQTSSELYNYTDNAVNINLYAQKTIEEVPILGSQVNAAPILWEQVQTASLGEGFYNIWKASRDLSYYLIIIPTVAFGFAIMFRMQINPQTQVTLMRAIPRLLTVILLITFSYPICALIVQLVEPIHDAAIILISQFASAAMPEFSGGTIGADLWDIVFSGSFSVVSNIGRGIFGLIFVAIMGLIAVIAGIRYLLAAFVTAIKLGFTIAFSPLILLIAAFPGREEVIKQFFINVSAYAFGFGAISIMYVLSWLILQIAIQTEGLLGFLGFAFVAMGILWKSPSAPKMIGQAMGAKSLLASDDKRR